MKKLISFIILFLPLASVAGSISGTVTDAATGAPLSGVSVYISDTRSGTFTDSSGAFFLGNISGGSHLIEYSHVGFGTLAIQVIINGDTRIDVRLFSSILENNAVIVTGVSRASQLRKVPFTVAVMRKEELQQTVSANIIDAITRKAGVSAIATGPAISKPVIRGLGYNRVLTMNDGVRQEGQQWGDEHGIEIDEASVNKIEILKGPASLVYGSDAMAGVINIITNVPVPMNTLKANIGSNYQTNNRLRSLYGNIAGNSNGFNWNVYGTAKAAADYKNKYDGYVFNSKFNENNAGGYIGYNGNWGFSHLLLSSFNLTTGLVEGERDNNGNFLKALPLGETAVATADDFRSTQPAIPRQHIRHFKIAIDNNFRIGKSNLTLNTGFQRNRREEFGNTDDIKERSIFFDLKTVTYAAQFHLPENNGWKPSVGTNGMNQTNTNRGAEQLIPDYKLTDLGVFFFVEKDLNKLTFSGGGRYDTRQLKANDLLDETGMVKGVAFRKRFSNFSGSAGLAYEINKQVNLKLNVARAFRAPSIPELASNGIHEGTIRYEHGDVNLKSEVSTQVDASMELNSEHVSFDLAGYVNGFSNFIFYRKLEAVGGGDSVVVLNGEMNTAFTFDQRKATLAGIEATLDIHPHPVDWLHFQNTFSFVAGNFRVAKEGSKHLPFIPAPKLLTELRGDFKNAGKYIRKIYAKFEVENTFKQTRAFTAFNTETATAGYTLMNAGLGADITGKKGRTLFIVNLGANNIGDVAYQSHLSRLKYAPANLATGRNGVFNRGRNFSLKLNVPLSVVLKKA
ncbi:MAG: TonB-dependent receptor [Ferruginibacter sp.]